MTDFFDSWPTDVFYERQIVVLFEKRFYHWITTSALHELSAERKINTDLVELTGPVKIRFYWSKGNRYWKRQAEKIRQVVLRFSGSDFTTALGHHGEMMFDAALARKGFLPTAFNVNEYAGKKWLATSENLDRIYERDGIAYGAEIKNTLDYIPENELKNKIRMCQTVGLVPLFIMRFAPKSYIFEIYKAGGFSLIFERQSYPYGNRSLAKQVQDLLRMPVDCPKAVEDGHIQRFLKWHLMKVAAKQTPPPFKGYMKSFMLSVSYSIPWVNLFLIHTLKMALRPKRGQARDEPVPFFSERHA